MQYQVKGLAGYSVYAMSQHLTTLLCTDKISTHLFSAWPLCVLHDEWAREIDQFIIAALLTDCLPVCLWVSLCPKDVTLISMAVRYEYGTL